MLMSNSSTSSGFEAILIGRLGRRTVVQSMMIQKKKQKSEVESARERQIYTAEYQGKSHDAHSRSTSESLPQTTGTRIRVM